MSILSLLYIKFKFISLYFNFSNILSLISVPLVMLQLINLLYYVYKDLRTKSTDLYQFKITNFYYTFFCIGLYIVFFILLIYGLRIVYINKTLDLRALYYRLYDLVILFMLLPFMLRFYVIFVLILSLLLILFVFVNIQTLCYKEFFKLHIYLCVSDLNKDVFPFKYMYCNTLWRWGWYHVFAPDLISGYIKSFIGQLELLSDKRITKITSIEKIYYYLFKNNYRFIRRNEKTIIKKTNKLAQYIFRSKYYKWLFNISPILIILYDCYFYNWILINIFYFMIVYGPLLIIRRVSIFTHELQRQTIRYLKTLYYENNKYMICIPKDFKISMINMYLLNGLRSNTHKFGLAEALDGSAEHDHIYMATNSYFLDSHTANMFDPNPNMYISTGDVSILKTQDNKFYRFIYEHKLGEFELGEEWIVLEDKYGIEKPWTKVEYEQEEEMTEEEMEEIWAKVRSEKRAW